MSWPIFSSRVIRAKVLSTQRAPEGLRASGPGLTKAGAEAQLAPNALTKIKAKTVRKGFAGLISLLLMMAV